MRVTSARQFRRQFDAESKTNVIVRCTANKYVIEFFLTSMGLRSFSTHGEIRNAYKFFIGNLERKM
jgi:hypothetical protein